MSNRSLLFAALISAPLWALIYLAGKHATVTACALLGITVVALLVWGVRKELTT